MRIITMRRGTGSQEVEHAHWVITPHSLEERTFYCPLQGSPRRLRISPRKARRWRGPSRTPASTSQTWPHTVQTLFTHAFVQLWPR